MIVIDEDKILTDLLLSDGIMRNNKYLISNNYIFMYLLTSINHYLKIIMFLIFIFYIEIYIHPKTVDPEWKNN